MIQILSFNPLLKHSNIQMGLQQEWSPDACSEPHCPGARSAQIVTGVTDVHGDQQTGAKWSNRSGVKTVPSDEERTQFYVQMSEKQFRVTCPIGSLYSVYGMAY